MKTMSRKIILENVDLIHQRGSTTIQVATEINH